MVIGLREDTLAEHHHDPAVEAEQLVTCLIGKASLTEERNALRQARGNLHVAAALPIRGIVALCDLVMEDDEVADMLHFAPRLLVEALDRGRGDAIEGEILDQPSH